MCFSGASPVPHENEFSINNVSSSSSSSSSSIASSSLPRSGLVSPSASMDFLMMSNIPFSSPYPIAKTATVPPAAPSLLSSSASTVSLSLRCTCVYMLVVNINTCGTCGNFIRHVRQYLLYLFPVHQYLIKNRSYLHQWQVV